jgi:hypothetical protein
MIERRSEQGARISEKGASQLSALLLGHVLDDRDRGLHLTVLVHQWGGLQQVPPLNASVAIDGAKQQRLGRLATQDRTDGMSCIRISRPSSPHTK